MSPKTVFPDYDYTVHDDKGVRGFKDEEELPISRENWGNSRQYHSDSGCMECSFVQDTKTLFVFMVPREKRNSAGTKPEFVGKFTMPGWAGHSSFYMFRCKYCDEIVVDYPHGYRGDSGLMYLRCSNGNCQSEIDMTSAEAYERDNLFVPLALRPSKERRKILKEIAESSERFRENLQKVEDLGVRPLSVGEDDGVGGTLWNKVLRFFRLKS